MTQKDYIKHGNPKANNRGGKGKKTVKSGQNQAPAIQREPIPFVAIAIALLVLGAFGYFLWAIKGAANDAPQSYQAPKTAKVERSKPVQSEPDIPPPPKNDWDYPDELRKKEVEVEKKQLEKKGPFLMQCATFKDSQRAEAFRAQLALLGFESRIKVTKSSTGGYHHRVQLGPYELNRDAQKARHKLSRHNINGCKIWLWS